MFFGDRKPAVFFQSLVLMASLFLLTTPSEYALAKKREKGENKKKHAFSMDPIKPLERSEKKVKRRGKKNKEELAEVPEEARPTLEKVVEASEESKKTKEPFCIPTLGKPLNKFKDFSGKEGSLVRSDQKGPTLAIFSNDKSGKEVEEFLTAFSAPMVEKKIREKVDAVRDRMKSYMDNVSGLFGAKQNLLNLFESKSSDDSVSDSNPDVLPIALFADLRKGYKPELQQGWNTFYAERERARQRGAAEGAAQGAAKPGFLANVLTLGIASDIGARKGAGIGSQIAWSVADILGPAKLTQLAEEAILADVSGRRKTFEDRLKAFSNEVAEKANFSALVDPRDFANHVGTRDARNLAWANSWAQRSGNALDVQAAQKTQQQFSSQTEDVKEVMDTVLGRHDSGFHVALVSPSGRTLRSWSNGKVDPKKIYEAYRSAQRMFQKDSGGTENPNDSDCDGVSNGEDLCSGTVLEEHPDWLYDRHEEDRPKDPPHRKGPFVGCNDGQMQDTGRARLGLPYRYYYDDEDGDGILNGVDLCPDTVGKANGPTDNGGYWTGCGANQFRFRDRI